MKHLNTTRNIFCFALALLFSAYLDTTFGQTLTSDKNDYPPGDTAILMGSGFSFGEPVTLQVLHSDMMGGIDSIEAHQPWEVISDSLGNFTTIWYVYPDGDQDGANLVAIADGQSSNTHAEVFFTDAASPVICTISGNLSGCAGSTINYTGPTGLGYTYLWQILNNNTGASISGSATSKIVIVNIGSTAGTFDIQLKVTAGTFTICSKTIAVNESPSCAITPATPVCPGSQNVYSGPSQLSAYSWSISGNGSFSGDTHSQSVTVNSQNVCNGSYTLTLIATKNGCVSTCSQVISLIDNISPSIGLAGANYSVSCGENPIFTAPTASDDCSSPSVVEVSDITAPGACAGLYSRTKSWKAVDACNNESGIVSQTINMIDNTAPFIGSPGGDANLSCPASPVFTAPVASDLCDGNPDIIVVSDETIQGDFPGVYSRTLCWKAVDCSGNESETVCQTINIINNTAPFIGIPVNACMSYTLPWGQVVTSSSDYSHAYSSAYGCDSTVTIHVTINQNYNVTGTAVAACVSYTLPWGQAVTSTSDYSHTYSSATGCDSIVTIHVTINPLPTATASGNSAVCATSTVNLNSTGGVSYSWTGPNGFTSLLQNPSISNATVAAGGSYAVTVTNTSGCSATANTSLTVNVKPTATASSNPGCVGSTLNLISGGGTSYSWTGPNGFISSLQNPTISNITTAAGGTYTVAIANSAGCSSTATTAVTVTAKPTATASSNSPLAGGTTLNLASAGGSAYSWTGPNAFTSSSQNPIIVNAAAAMAGTYTVVVSNSNGCTAIATTPVVITCAGFKSYTITQGGWGADPGGNNPAVYRNATFPYAFPNGLTIGCGSNWLYLTTSLAVQNFLPSGGTAISLTQSYTNPGSALSNTLAGQIAALGLNIGFDDYDAAFAPSTSMHLRDLYVKRGPFIGWTVLQVYNEAQKKLGGCSTSYTAAQLNGACTSINMNYDGGTVDRGFLSCIPVRLADVPSIDGDGLKLYPNPNNGVFVLELNLEEAITSTIDIEVMNMFGQLIYLNQTEAIDGILRQEVKFDNNLPDGSYLVRVISGDHIYTHQIIYQR